MAPSEADSLAGEIAERIERYTEPATGLRPVLVAARSRDIYSGPQLAQAPELIIGTRPGYRMSWQTAIGGLAEDVLSPNEKRWSGDHIVYPKFVPGTIMSNLKLDVGKAKVQDIAPTVLNLLGVKAPEPLDGQALPRPP